MTDQPSGLQKDHLGLDVLGQVQRQACARALGVVAAALMTGLFLLAVLAVLAPHAIHPASALSAAGAEGRPAGLFFKGDASDALFEAPTVASDVEIDVSGQIARVTVRQHFVNPSDAWLEGIYVFPLPERSAVDRLVMTVDARRIEGRIMPREEAKQVYEQAAREGRRASLLSSERPNVFVTSVANIGPGQEIIVEIEFQDRVAYSDGLFALRFPMVVAPRYTPGAPAAVAGMPNLPVAPRPAQPIAHQGPVGSDSPAELAPGRDLFGPVRPPSEDQHNPVALQVVLDAGIELAALESPSHEITIEPQPSGRQRIALADGSVPADRDFVLEWRPAIGGAPEAAIFGEEIDGESYLMVTVVPPEPTSGGPSQDIGPRDLILVVDTSGSMHGMSIEAARKALRAALERLRPEDRFNLIRFDSDASALFPDLRGATPEHLRLALRAVDALEAGGGTNMRPALKLALDGKAQPGRLRQVVFMTDGAVGNEQELFRIIAERLGATRFFTVGIGSAPNGYFMRKAAELGRGSFTYIAHGGLVAERMDRLLRKLEQPALTDLTVGWPASDGKKVETSPMPLPDVYAGEPVVFAARLSLVPLAELDGAMLLSGKRPGGDWQRRLPLTGIEPAPGVAAVWARAKLAQIEDGRTLGRDPAEVRSEALALALRHRLVTRYTSLVAVDDEIVRPNDAALQGAEVPRNLPAGWDHTKVFGSPTETMPLRQLPAPLLRKAGLQGEQVSLPQTATPATQLALSGLGLVALGAFVLLTAGRLRRASAAQDA